jgi:hypothetical protein
MSGDLSLPPIVWRVPFSASITARVISDHNPKGDLTNSDLEMAAVLLHYMVLTQQVDMRYIRTGVWSDNTPTVAWTTRMADHSQAPTAGRLLRGLAAIQRSVQAGPLTIDSIAGKDNDMADIASRSFDIQCDSAFLTHFSQRFPLPQQQSWTLAPLTQELTSLVTSTLDGKRLPLQQWTTACKPKIGTPGWNSAATHDGIPTCSTPPNLSNNNCSSASLLGSGAATTVKERKCKLRPRKPPSATWRRPSCWLDTQTLGAHTAPKTSTCPSPDSSEVIKPMTLPHSHNWHSPSEQSSVP